MLCMCCVTRWDLQEQRSPDRRKTGSAMDQKMKRRIIMIGRSMAGKTTLCQYLSDQQLKYKKTQAVEIINKNMIDHTGRISGTYLYARCTDGISSGCGHHCPCTGCDGERYHVPAGIFQQLCKALYRGGYQKRQGNRKTAGGRTEVSEDCRSKRDFCYQQL